MMYFPSDEIPQFLLVVFMSSYLFALIFLPFFTFSYRIIERRLANSLNYSHLWARMINNIEQSNSNNSITA